MGPLGNRAVGLSTKPLHQAGSPEEDTHLYRLPACSTAGSLCFWFHPLALHQDDLPCCSCSVPPSQASPSSSTAGAEIPRSHRPNYKGLIHHVQFKKLLKVPFSAISLKISLGNVIMRWPL